MSFFKPIRVMLFVLPLYAISSWAQTVPVVVAPAQPAQAGQIVAEPGQVIPRLNPLRPKPLIIGVDTFTPPFAMRGGNGELFGYDISMMNSLCKIMNRPCQFQPMKWIELLPAIMNNQINLAVSSITITPERTKDINFSLPYALSYSRFLTMADTPTVEPFTFSSLEGKNIGVEEGTIYENQVTHLGINNPIVKSYDGDPEALKGLSNKEVDYVLLDNPTALYWAANSSGAFKVIGKPFAYGFGIGIAVSKADINLIPELNKALIEYQGSTDYQQNYHRFLETF
jgi:polar amino acid transport system substrate-binding protein